jgi:methylated-DNA-protein-cysteine methyltransferase-like protein
LSHPPPPNAAPWPDDHEPTEFQQAVIDAVAALEEGELVTYGELAEELGRPGGGQAVANVLRSVPDLPWWRVVPAEGRLYCSHLPVQGPLLEAEGHTIDEHRRFRPTRPGTG